MRFLEHPGLSRLSALLKDLDVGDRILCGRLELFSTNDLEQMITTKEEIIQKHQPLSNKEKNGHHQTLMVKSLTSSALPLLKRELNNDTNGNETSQQPNGRGRLINSDSDGTSSSSSSSAAKEETSLIVPDSTRKRTRSRGLSDLSHQPGSKRRRSSSVSSWKLLGAHTPAEARKLLVQLVNTMNACFPDYDFSSVTPEAFEHIENFVTVYTTINYHLSFIVERIIPGFLQDLWASIKDAINLRNASIYSYTNRSGKIESDPYVDDELCLFSFDYFLVDDSTNKILFFSCMTKRKPSPSSYEVDGSNWYYDEDDDDQSKSLSPSSSSGELEDGDGNHNSDDDEAEDQPDNDDEEEDEDLLYGEIRY